MLEKSVAAIANRPLSEAGEPLHSSFDDIIAIYKKDVDRSLLRESLNLSVTERFERFEQIARQFAEIHEAGRRHRGEI